MIPTTPSSFHTQILIDTTQQYVRWCTTRSSTMICHLYVFILPPRCWIHMCVSRRQSRRLPYMYYAIFMHTHANITTSKAPMTANVPFKTCVPSHHNVRSHAPQLLSGHIKYSNPHAAIVVAKLKKRRLLHEPRCPPPYTHRN